MVKNSDVILYLVHLNLKIIILLSCAFYFVFSHGSETGQYFEGGAASSCYFFCQVYQ